MNAILETIGWIMSGISIYGVYINIKKNPLCFKLWLFTNGFWFVYDIYKQAYPQAFIFAVYFALATKGIYEWKKEGKK